MASLTSEMIKSEDEIRVSSRVVAEKFDKNHRDVLRSIRNLECSEEFSLRNFARSTFKNEGNREFEEYLMTRDGFSILVMGFTGKESMKWKEQFIKAFNLMERKLAKSIKDEVWQAARLQGKTYRFDLTDCIKEFVEYAVNQGSQNAKRYYQSITSMEYVALGLIEKSNVKIGPNFRDTLDRMQINVLCMAEQIAQHWIKEGMNQKLHYKEIYQLAKSKVEEYADIACITYIN